MKGKRVYLHPRLQLLDTIDCEVWYDREFQFFYVEYDYINGVFSKSILTKQIDSVVNEINKYKSFRR